MVELQEAARLPGTFIVLEGGEGTGKSTQVAVLVERLRESGHEVVATREPGGSAISERIRDLILQDSSVGMSPRCEALLFAAARAEHVSSLIRPALERGAVVVSDRFVDSSIAYQGVGRDLGQSDIAEISRWATDDVAADLTILLDLDPVVGLARALDPNRLEAEDLAFHIRVQETFSSLARADPSGHIVVPADQTPEQVADEVWRVVETTLRRPDPERPELERTDPERTAMEGTNLGDGPPGPTPTASYSAPSSPSSSPGPSDSGTGSNPRSGSRNF